MAELFGTPGNDTINGTTTTDFISGLLGNDILNGLDGDDSLNGNQGNDTLDGGVGNDLVRGGQDNDRLLGNSGNDTIIGDLGNDTAFGGDGDDFLIGDQRTEFFSYYPYYGWQSAYNGDGDDFLFGEQGNDTLWGLDGNDSLVGNQGDDEINGNQGSDTVFGGEGNDLLRGGIDNDQIFGEVGNDTLYGDLGDDTVVGAEEQDTIAGGRGDDSLLGNADDDDINGNQGNDTVVGGDGNDVLRGGRDNDLVLGETGNDFLYGDKGIDTLTGGDGNDTFFLRKNLGGASLAEADVITDFVNSTDLIGLIEGLKFEDLTISQGTGANTADTIIQDSLTGQFLAVLKGVNQNTIDRTDFVLLGVLAFSNSKFQVNENGTPVSAATITRTDGSDGTVSITVTPSNGSAIAPNDYNNGSVVVTLASGETSKTVTIPIVDDNLGEYTETINLTLADAKGGATIGTQNTAILEILDNESVLEFSAPTFQVNEDGTAIAAVTVKRTNGANGAASVTVVPTTPTYPYYPFNFYSGTATPNVDYNPTSVVVNFANGDSTPKTVTIPIVNDAVGEKTETINLSLQNPTNARIGDQSTATLEIVDNDPLAVPKLTLHSPNNSYGFGNQIAFVGNNVLVGSPYENTGANSSGAAYLFDGTTGTLLKTFLDPTPNEGNNFGDQIAVMGNNVLISAHYDNTGANSAGAVYLFDSSTGALLKTFLNPSPNEYDNFGNQIAFVGSNILIGTPYDDTGANDAGAAYLFDSNTGALLKTFLNPTPNEGDNFCNRIAFVGNNVLISAPYDDTGANDAGAAYLFDSSTGALLKTFLNPTPKEYDNFGYQIAAVGDNVLISAPYDDTSGNVAGAAYLFDSNSGALLKTFLNPTPNQGDWFGNQIAVMGDKILISAPNDDTGGNEAGAAYLFDSNSEALLRTFLNPSPSNQSYSYDLFGSQIAAFGNNVAISAPGNNQNQGAAYLFDSSTGGLLKTILNPDPNQSYNLGNSLVLMGDNILMASLWGANGSTVYLF